MSKKIVIPMFILAALGVYVMVQLNQEPPPGEEPSVLERLLPPLPVPEPRAPGASIHTSGNADLGRGDEEPGYAAGLQAAAAALLGPLDGGGGDTLAQWKTRAANDPTPAGRAAAQAIRRLESVAQRRQTALANLDRLENRAFRSFDQGDAAKKKEFFEAQARRQWEEYAASIRPQIERALTSVRAAEQ